MLLARTGTFASKQAEPAEVINIAASLAAPVPGLIAEVDTGLIVSANLGAPVPALSAVVDVPVIAIARLAAPVPGLGAVVNVPSTATASLAAPVPGLAATLLLTETAAASLGAPVPGLSASVDVPVLVFASLRAPVPGLNAAINTGGLDLAGLLHWYNFDEVSGNRVDSHGGTAVFEPGSAGTNSAAGKIGNAASFATSNNTRLQYSESPLSIFNNTWYITCWINPVNVGLNGINPWSSYGGTSNTSSRAQLIRNGNESTQLRLRSGASNRTLNALVTTPPDQWHFIECFYNASNLQIGIAINGGDFALNTMINPPPTGTNTVFFVGGTTQTSSLFRGEVDELTIWTTLPDNDRRAALWNGGAGITYPN